MTPFIIADLGTSHRGSLEKALKAIEVVKECGADAAKFQLYDHEALFGFPGKLPFELPPDWVPQLAEHATKVGVEFMATGFSVGAIGVLDPYVRRHKLASSDFTHPEMVTALVKTGKPLIASTGGQSHNEVAWFLNFGGWVLGDPSQDFRTLNRHSLTLLECVALYPAPPDVYDLNVLKTWLRMGLAPIDVGVSDHTMGESVAVAAVGAGATVFEKHLDPFFGDGETPDQCVSVTRSEFALYVQAIREAASAMGDGRKQPRHQHQMQLRWRRRLIATKTLLQGDTLVLGENYGPYRSLKDDGHGWGPHLVDVNGRRTTKMIEMGESIGPGDVA